MGGYKRKRTGPQGKRPWKKRADKNSAIVARQHAAIKRYSRYVMRKMLDRNIETKRSCQSTTDGQEIWHNNFVSLDSTLLQTSQGVQDPSYSATNNRIGDKINIRGVSLKGMVEMNERYTDVTIRILVVRSAKGDTPTRTTLFNGLSGNKMLDTINTERYSVLASKLVKMRPGGLGTTGAQYQAVIGQDSGVYLDTGGKAANSRVTKIWKMWIPGKKFTKGGVLTYEDNTGQAKFFDYHVLMYAYSNYSTLQDVYYVARNNDYIKQMYFKDA